MTAVANQRCMAHSWDSLFDEVYAAPPRALKGLDSALARREEVRLGPKFPAGDLRSQQHWRKVWLTGGVELSAALPDTVEWLGLSEFSGLDLQGLQLPPATSTLLVQGKRLRSLNGLKPGLRALYLLEARLEDLEELAAYSDLEHLAVVGPFTDMLRVGSLAPLAGLTGLRSLYLGNLRVGDQSLAPLHGMRSLERCFLDLASFPLPELAQLARALPQLPSEVLGPSLATEKLCPQCQTMMVVLRGTAAPPGATPHLSKRIFYCPNCDCATVQHHLAAFERLKNV
jgi:hypothetical protein